MIKKVPKVKRVKVEVSGIVQGVGFRPFVYNLAKKLLLTGFVTNTSEGVIIEIEGKAGQINRFTTELKENPPVLSSITQIAITNFRPINSESFEIVPSVSGSRIQTIISPDSALCADCREELLDPENRRFRYPFINCTNCGPRFTIISDIPYDRPATTMADFIMCPECQSEYEDPKNRRFHAQPNACQSCGPRVWLEDPADNKRIASDDEATKLTAEYLNAGKIVAVKGLGGFHLMVDAGNDEAVKRLRRRKHREEKALAIMVKDLATAKKIVQLDPESESLLCAYQSPIVLLRKKIPNLISDFVAPGNPNLGIMLPYTPLHHILLNDFAAISKDEIPALVATSGNLTDEPIAIKNEDARTRLKDITDYILLHDRDILVRADDSVVTVVHEKPIFFRRSRGYTPRPVMVKNDGPDILAVGPELKNTICILKEDQAFLSQHIGDLENILAFNSFEASIEHFQKIVSSFPDIIAYDLHPNYLSTQWALKNSDKKLIPVQHHHAHLAAAMAEYQLENPVIGIILDGTGYGYDDTIWGGEVLIGDFTQLTRFAHLEKMIIPGGEVAIKNPWRIAAGYLYLTFGREMPELSFMKNYSVDSIYEMVDKNINCVTTSSCGRLFDAVAVMAGGKTEVHYEAQAAIEMMNAVSELEETGYSMDLSSVVHKGIIPVKELIRNVAKDVASGTGFPVVAGKFHRTLIDVFTQVALLGRTETNINDVVLSGGVFQNEILLRGLIQTLEKKRFKVYVPQQLAVNDGGVSLGQAMIAARLIEKNLDSVVYKKSFR